MSLHKGSENQMFNSVNRLKQHRLLSILYLDIYFNVLMTAKSSVHAVKPFKLNHVSTLWPFKINYKILRKFIHAFLVLFKVATDVEVEAGFRKCNCILLIISIHNDNAGSISLEQQFSKYHSIQNH